MDWQTNVDYCSIHPIDHLESDGEFIGVVDIADELYTNDKEPINVKRKKEGCMDLFWHCASE